MSETILNMLPLTEEEKAVFEAAAPDAVHLYAGRRTATPEQFAQATVILGWPRPNMVAQAAHLKWFHCMWAGTEEYVDVMPAGAALTSSAGTNSQSVSEHLLASLLALYRKLPLCRDRQREHKWDQDIGSVRTLVGATVLVAGAGHVGSAFAQLCKALGAKRTIGLKRSVNVPVPGFDELFPLSELDRLLPQADVVALTLPHTPETDGLMDRARLARMKEDAVLLSAGRGHCSGPGRPGGADEWRTSVGHRSGRHHAGAPAGGQPPVGCAQPAADLPMWRAACACRSPGKTASAWPWKT